MKKYLALILIAVLSLSLFACVRRPLPSLPTHRPTSAPTAAPETAAAPTEAPTEAPETDAPIETEPAFVVPALSDCVGLLSEVSVDYIDGVDNYCNATYRLPELYLSSSDAKRANDLIRTTFQPRIDESLQAEMNKTSLVCTGITYDTWIYDKYLSLVITEDSLWGGTYYMVFTFDLTDNSWLGNKEYAAYLRTDEYTLRDMVSSSLLYYFDEDGADLPDEYKDDFYYMQRQHQTEAVYVDATELFIDRNGGVQMSCWICSIAGADSYAYLKPLIY